MRASTSAVRTTVLVALLAAIVASAFLLPVKEYLGSFLEWVRNVGPLGAVALGALYIPACLAFFPGSLLTLGAGFAFGVVWGTITVSAGSVLGATAAFLAGRTLARRAIERRVARAPKFAAIDRAVADQGFKIVLLTRLSPVFPFNILNYAYGLTRVSLRDYVLASWIGMFPGTVLYVYLGSAVKSIADLASGAGQGGAGRTVLFAVGLAATIAVTIVVTRIARQALSRAVDGNAAVAPVETVDSAVRNMEGVTP